MYKLYIAHTYVCVCMYIHIYIYIYIHICIYIHTRPIDISHIKRSYLKMQRNPAIWDNVDETGGHYTK